MTSGTQEAAVRRRRRRIGLVAVLGILLVAAVPVGLALDRDDPAPVPPVPVEPPACPERFAGPAGWVPAPPPESIAGDRLVPAITPEAAVVCAYDVEVPGEGGALPDPRGEGPLSREAALGGALDLITQELTWLPPSGPGDSRVCPDDPRAGGQRIRSDYLLGLTYPDGVVWVSTRSAIPDCGEVGNGRFTSPTTMAGRFGAWLEAETYTREIRPDYDLSVPECYGWGRGRLGQEKALVPQGAVSVQVCAGVSGSTEGRRTGTALTDVDELIRALDGLPTVPARPCDPIAEQPEYFMLLFRYTEGPPVLVTFDPNCDPALDNGHLAVRNDRSSRLVLGLVKALLERTAPPASPTPAP